ncbi:hypothetical protein FJT64_025899 [Amphibalanus amphitrite]|uniref:Uncharacterized protein n=1 Tax=Amphibalanus amphitrite TaxID=1232801 RepID=A0A6A4W7E9_AMPAM|nr:hypothetical protein FJT64_013363 [Amphibalanus amphitrite]KAF0301943.1 hypothetical protein FJT64_025899 [Amphibalanus amphitrite]
MFKEAIAERRAARAALREGDSQSRVRWIAAKRRAAELEKKATITHFNDFVSTTLNQPANVGRVHKTLKKWERCCANEFRDGQAMLRGDRLIITDRDKAEAFVQEYARVSRQVRTPISQSLRHARHGQGDQWTPAEEGPDQTYYGQTASRTRCSGI